MTETGPQSGVHDFDFLHGSWSIVNDRLTSRLSGSNEWERFEARGVCQSVLAGQGNIDDFRPEWPGHAGFEGGTLRVFNPTTGLWSLYWFDNVVCAVMPPVHGRFQDGIGEFFGDDEHAGVPVRQRFRWTEITATSARWDQALSTDNGATWETNWIMTFSRIDS